MNLLRDNLLKKHNRVRTVVVLSSTLRRWAIFLVVGDALPTNGECILVDLDQDQE